jgi:ankyrin repeat protein
LRAAVVAGDLSGVIAGCDVGASPDAHMNRYDDDRVIHEAAWNGRGDIVWALLARGADLDLRGKEGTLLHYAARSGRADAINLLFEERLDPNPFNEGGLAPLQYAAESGRVEAVEALLVAGASPRRRPCPSLGEDGSHCRGAG